MSANPVTTLQPASQIAPVQSEGAAIIHMIERAARDPAVDIDKMQRLLELRRQIKADEAKVSFARAMKSAQSEMRPVARDSNNPQTHSRYASYGALDNAVRPIYTKHGFSLTFDTGEGAPELHVRVICEVMHDDGHSRTYRFDIPADGKGAKGNDVMTKTHAAMSAVSYGKRGLLTMIFNISTGEFDDDGNAASTFAAQPAYAIITASQAETLRRELSTKIVGTEARLLTWAKAERIEDILADKYDRALAHVKSVAAA